MAIWADHGSVAAIVCYLELEPVLRAIERVDWPEPRPARRRNPYLAKFGHLLGRAASGHSASVDTVLDAVVTIQDDLQAAPPPGQLPEADRSVRASDPPL